MRLLARLAPWIFLLLFCSLLWAVTDTPFSATLLYLVVVIWTTALPGIAIYKMACRRRTSFFTDCAVGTTIGLIVSIFVWLALTAAGLQQLYLAWPLVALAVTAFPRWRPIWRQWKYESLPGSVSVWIFVLAAAISLGVLGRKLFADHSLPPHSALWYQDTYWHMALSAQLMHNVPPNLPQIANLPFWYHWYANAHIASISQSAGIDLALVVTRLWMPAVVVLGLAMLVVVIHELTSAYWPGCVAAFMAAGGTTVVLPSWFGVFGNAVSTPLSPSQQLAIPVGLLALFLLIPLVRDAKASLGHWLLLILALAGCSGSKGSVLPVILAGLLFITALRFLIRRQKIRGSLLSFLATALVFLASSALLAGGSAGVHLQLFSTISSLSPWLYLTGPAPFAQTFLPFGIGNPGALLLLGLLLFSYVVAFSYVWAALGWQSQDFPVFWWLFGTGLAGFGAMVVLSQDGLSQIYFFSFSILAWLALGCAGLFYSWQASVVEVGRRKSLGTVFVTAALSTMSLALIRAAFPMPTKKSLINGSIFAGLASWCLLSALVILIAVFLKQHRCVLWLAFVAMQFSATQLGWHNLYLQTQFGRNHWLLPLLLVCIAIAAPGLYLLTTPSKDRTKAKVIFIPLSSLLAVALSVVFLHSTFYAAHRPLTRSPRLVTTDEITAARWLRDHSDPKDIVATNLHCMTKKTRPYCDARSFWVGAFTERGVFLEGWAYSKEAHEAHGKNGRRYSNQPFHDREKFSLNEDSFYRPSQKVMAALWDQGVRWMYIDAAAGKTSPSLQNYCSVTFAQGTVKICRLNNT